MFTDKIIFITGAANGIGRAAALAFAARGGTVIAADINASDLAETINMGAAAGGKLVGKQLDVSDFAEVSTVIEEIVREYGRIDVAVNNAGIGGVMARLGDVRPEDWDQMMAINTSGVFYCMRQQLRQMAAQAGGGAIVNVASVAGLRALPNSAPYVAAKHAVIGLTKTAAREYARKGIRVNALCPGFTVTGLFDPEAVDAHSAGASDQLRSLIPLGRFADVSEQIGALLWLASSEASFVTGMSMVVDGGLSA
ncbi:SDR family NAD(P)-dependent oxidoreductase [Lewinella sp. 4G2]|uniref:SDR family NAD(P)-dependent oxidoreductase n=1 Tax=Lewinella sp. 4G2 TaxID=1803372 RepID=UPI0007B4EF8C|nr:SDR family oxidoreductase [Lewinella sp. 4G2]OAV43347.1 hypothetical protein A3850_002035 [Lewinella sp. 4G2]